jgi:hypothetical protein
VYISRPIDAQILIMCLYLSLNALHVSDCLVHHQERLFGAVYRNWYKPVSLAVARQQPDLPAPYYGLKSPKHVEHLVINKDTL